MVILKMQTYLQSPKYTQLFILNSEMAKERCSRVWKFAQRWRSTPTSELLSKSHASIMVAPITCPL